MLYHPLVVDTTSQIWLFSFQKGSKDLPGREETVVGTAMVTASELGTAQSPSWCPCLSRGADLCRETRASKMQSLVRGWAPPSGQFAFSCSATELTLCLPQKIEMTQRNSIMHRLSGNEIGQCLSQMNSGIWFLRHHVGKRVERDWEWVWLATGRGHVFIYCFLKVATNTVNTSGELLFKLTPFLPYHFE